MSALLQTAMANASLQSGHPPSPAKSGKRLPSDRGRVRSSASASSKDMTDEEDSEDHAGYSDDDSDDDEMVALATRPTTPVPSHSRERETPDSPEKAGRFVAARDPVSYHQVLADGPILTGRFVLSFFQVRMLPSSIMLRVFLQLDIKSLARCDRVCKRWRKSQTLNYSEYRTCSVQIPISIGILNDILCYQPGSYTPGRSPCPSSRRIKTATISIVRASKTPIMTHTTRRISSPSSRHPSLHRRLLSGLNVNQSRPGAWLSRA